MSKSNSNLTSIELITSLQKTGDKYVLKKAHEWLEGRVHDPEVFCRWLKQTNTVMMGSAPLQMLLGENWRDSDIDLWVMDKSKDDLKLDSHTLRDLVNQIKANECFTDNKVELEDLKPYFKYLPGCGYRSQFDINYYSEMGCYLRNNINYLRHNHIDNLSRYNSSVDILKVHYYSYHGNDNEDCTQNKECKGCTPVQIIQIDPNKHSSFKSMADSFDFDFCKVIFDGEKFEVLKPEAILKKESYQQKKKWCDEKRYEMRVKKYTERGFSILKKEN